MKPSSVLLVVPPFASCEFPSLESGVLGAVLHKVGIDSTTRYLSNDFSATIGRKLYTQIANIPPPRGVADWIAAGHMSRIEPPHSARSARIYKTFEHYLETELQATAGEIATFRVTRELWDSYSRAFAADLIGQAWSHVVLICHHQQLAACIHLASQINAQARDVSVVVTGGFITSLTQAEALLEACPAITTVMYAGGAATMERYSDRILAGESGPGFLSRGPISGGRLGKALHNGNLAAKPDFSDFYQTYCEDPVLSVLPLQAGQGCWWADQRHCTFCGLIPPGETHSAKASLEVLNEIIDQVGVHETMHFVSADHLLSRQHERELLPMLSAADIDVTGFFEIRATISKASLRALAAARVLTVEVGVESFDDDSLKHIDKGSTALINIRVLKWAHEIGLETFWTWIYGFPWETAESIRAQIEIAGRIRHLSPPLHATPLRLERDSPLWRDAAQHGLSNVRPAEAALHTYPLEVSNLSRLVRLFDYEVPRRRADFMEATVAVQKFVADWKANWRWDALSYRRGPDFIKICDNRSESKTVTLRGWRRDVFEALDDIRSRRSLSALCGDSAELSAFLEFMSDQSYICEAGDHIVSVVPRLNLQRAHFSRISGVFSAAPAGN